MNGLRYDEKVDYRWTMKLFVASAMKTDYPYKLQKPSTITQPIRDTAEEFIFDSGIGDDVSNEEVLFTADKYNADWVVAKDYLHDQQKTSESVNEFLDIYDDHGFNFTPLIPLQPPFDKHYQALSGFSHYVLGGMAVESVSVTQQYKWIRNFRNVEPDAYAHGLGVGGGIEFVQRFAGKGFLDSVDCATPEMAAQFGSILDKRLRQIQVRVMSGEGASKRNKALAEFNSWQIMDVWDRESKKMGLDHFH